MASRTPLPRAAAVLLLLTGAIAGCGADDDEPPRPPAVTSTSAAEIPGGGPPPRAATTATVPSPPPGDPGGTGAAPAADADAIRVALRRSPSGLVAARTVRVRFALDDGSVRTTGSGTADLTDGRYLVAQRVGRGPTTDAYGEEGRSFVESAPDEAWVVSDDPSGAGDPISLVRSVSRARVLRVGGVTEQGGGTCRTFEGTLPVSTLLGDVPSQDREELIGEGREDGTVPIRACVDDRGRVYAVDQEFSWSRTFGGEVGKRPGSSVTRVRLADYGEARAPRRPIGASIAGTASGTVQGPG
jgi:hypothetical protein